MTTTDLLVQATARCRDPSWNPGCTQPVLTDGVIRLRPWRPADAPALAAAFGDPEISHRIPLTQIANRVDADGWIVQATRRRTGAFFACTVPPRRKALGGLEAVPSETERDAWELGGWLIPELRGRGYPVRALRLVTSWLFERVGLPSVVAYVDHDHQSSKRALVAAGFRPDGLIVYDHIDGCPEQARFVLMQQAISPARLWPCMAAPSKLTRGNASSDEPS